MFVYKLSGLKKPYFVTCNTYYKKKHKIRSIARAKYKYIVKRTKSTNNFGRMFWLYVACFNHVFQIDHSNAVNPTNSAEKDTEDHHRH